MVGMMQPSASDGVAIMILVVLSVSMAGNRGGDARCKTTNGQAERQKHVIESYGEIQMANRPNS
jgi:hypothetical protein